MNSKRQVFTIVMTPGTPNDKLIKIKQNTPKNRGIIARIGAVNWTIRLP
jgi:hypothetical protein